MVSVKKYSGNISMFIKAPASVFSLQKWNLYSGIVALWSLALLAFERYIVICRPLRNTRLRGKHAALAIVFVWSFSFIWTVPPTAGWSSYTTSKIGTTCEPNWYSGAYADRTYIITFFTTCFIVPLLVILVSYGKLVQKLKKVSDAQGRLGTTRRPERQVTRMVVFMIIAFLICWMPYAAFSVLVTAYPSIELDPCLAAIPAFFSKTATVYNPIIYVFMNKQLVFEKHYCLEKEWFYLRYLWSKLVPEQYLAGLEVKEHSCSSWRCWGIRKRAQS
ncbi:Pinopsin [Turdus rufiventris]|nr:Pinopsin [Turdus rufiventris]